MTCAVPLASTGVPVATLVALGLLVLVVGLVLVRTARGRAALVAVPLLLVGFVAVDGRQADAAECVLVIEQTSVNAGLGPGVAPSRITVEVTNSAPESTVVEAITVRIAGVVKASGAVPGVCDASDYVVVDPRMVVGKVLGARESVVVSGAAIGFNDKSSNQDSCQGALVELRYLSE